MADNSRPGLQRLELISERKIDLRQQEQGNYCRLPQIRVKDVFQPERDQIRDTGHARGGSRRFDDLRVYFDSYASCLALQGRTNDDTAVAGSEIVKRIAA